MIASSTAMAEVETSTTEQEETFTELIGFLQDKKFEVQRLAAEGVLEYTESQDFLEYCLRKPRAVSKGLLRLAERSEAASSSLSAPAAESEPKKSEKQLAMEDAQAAAAGAAALKALVNLSTVPSVCKELNSMSACRRICENMRNGWLEGRADLVHWYAMLLANLTTSTDGQKSLCAEEALLRFLVAAFVGKARPPPRDGYDDPLQCLGKVICNVCALQEGRKVLAGEGAGPSLKMLAAELGDRGRRADIVSIFRNLCIDQACHPAILETDLLARLARFVYPWEQAEPERRAELPDELREVLQADGAALTTDSMVRHAVSNAVLGLCRSAEGRKYLRDGGCYEVLRSWHLEESNEDTRASIEAAVPLVRHSEEELQAARAKEQSTGEETPVAGVDAPAAAIVTSVGTDVES